MRIFRKSVQVCRQKKWIHLLKAFRAGVDRVASIVDKDDEWIVDSIEDREEYRQ